LGAASLRAAATLRVRLSAHTCARLSGLGTAACAPEVRLTAALRIASPNAAQFLFYYQICAKKKNLLPTNKSEQQVFLYEGENDLVR
jgi:hypothetical protein